MMMVLTMTFPNSRLRIAATEGSSGNGAQETLERLLPTHLTVLPR
jgi:hypothetical protein